MALSNPIMFKGGTLLLHDEDDNVYSRRADVLVKDSVIVRIDPDIESLGARILDCTDKIISPGFIDTHHHVWQTQLKGKHADQTLVEYLPHGNFISSLMPPEEIYWGQLSGALEALDAGTSTVVDHAHCNATPDHSRAAVRTTLTSRIRSVFCYTPTSSLLSWIPLQIDRTFPDWIMQTFKELAEGSPYAGGNGDKDRLMIGFGLLSPGAPRDFIEPLFAQARQARAQVITTHSNAGPIFGSNPGGLEVLGNYDLLGPDVIIAHHNRISSTEVQLLRDKGAYISSTPTTELQMGMCHPAAFAPRPGSVDPTETIPNVSLGVDCHSAVSSYMPAQMSLALTYARAEQHTGLAKDGKWTPSLTYKYKGWNTFRSQSSARPPFPPLTVQAAFNLGTTCGARAIRKEHELGRIAVGFKADFAVFDAKSPGLLAAAEQDPVAAIVMHSSVRDVWGVVVGGEICKWNGVLTPVSVPKLEGAGPVAGTKLEWEEVADRVLGCRNSLEARIKDIDFERVTEEVVNFFPMDKNAIP